MAVDAVNYSSWKPARWCFNYFGSERLTSLFRETQVRSIFLDS